VRRPGLLGLAALVATAGGCSLTGTTERAELGRYPSTGSVLYVGSIYDLRALGDAATGPDADAPAGPGAPELALQREVRIPPSEIRSVFAEGLAGSGLFARVVNPPAAFAGAAPDRQIARAQQSSDLLLVAEVSQFHIKSLGFNGRAGVSVPLDLLLAPFAFGSYLTTGGNMFLFTGSIMASWSAEVVLTASVSLIDVGTGHAVRTVRLEERARAPYDGSDAFGSLWDESDDWIDLGRRLGEVALHNAAVRLAERLHEELAGGRGDGSG